TTIGLPARLLTALGAAAGAGASGATASASGEGRESAGGGEDAGAVTAPVPGSLVDYLVDDGAEVEAGDEVAVVSAMKMETRVELCLKRAQWGRARTPNRVVDGVGSTRARRLSAPTPCPEKLPTSGGALMPRLSVGDTAPDFTLVNQDGNSVSLSDFKGQRVVVYFYPAAMTPGCTTEACDFRDSL